MTPEYIEGTSFYPGQGSTRSTIAKAGGSSTGTEADASIFVTFFFIALTL